MASPEELTPLLPETLPDDFSEWDGEAAPEPAPSKPNEWEAWEATHSFGEPTSPRGQSANGSSTVAPQVERPRDLGPSPSAPAVAPQPKHYVEWDGESSPTPKPGNLSEWEAWEAAHTLGKKPNTSAQFTEREANVPRAAERPHSSAPSAPAPVRQHEPVSKPSNGSNGSGSRPYLAPETSYPTKPVPPASGLPKVVKVNGALSSAAAAKVSQSEADSALFQAFAQTATAPEKPKAANKKWIMIGSAGAVAVLLPLAFLSPIFHRANGAPKQSVQPQQPTETQIQPDAANAPGTDSANQNQPAPASQPQPAAAAPANSGNGAQPASGPTKKQAKMMDDQLTAPTLIPQGGKPQAENAPPPVNLALNGGDGLGGASDGMPGARTQPSIKVVPSKPFDISSGIATGMLIRQTAPVYPAIAKAARISGTVVLQATITKNGTIKDLKVVSGPAMLQQAAADAVRTWRYKPYKLSNEPVEVQTTINVVFALQ
ncbi:MAG TPA: TonB family protein [Terracidiphilus sp.]|nr:TonB family protein [Terracidiphilus sp.]